MADTAAVMLTRFEHPISMGPITLHESLQIIAARRIALSLTHSVGESVIESVLLAL